MPISLIPKSFFDIHLSIANEIVSSKIYDKRNDFEKISVLFLEGGVPRCASSGEMRQYAC